TATNALLRSDGTVVETQQLVREHDAERFGVLPVTRPGGASLRLELLRRFPQILVEEVQARLELGLGELQLGIEHRPARIDVEVGDARERPRFLPAGNPVPGRNEAQPAAELVQGGLWQALDDRLAVIALSTFAHDEQVMR